MHAPDERPRLEATHPDGQHVNAGRLIVQRDARRAVIRKARQSVLDPTCHHDRDCSHAPATFDHIDVVSDPVDDELVLPAVGRLPYQRQRRTIGQVGRGALADVGEQLTVDHLHDRRHDIDHGQRNELAGCPREALGRIIDYRR